jgi:hypothetical protein
MTGNDSEFLWYQATEWDRRAKAASELRRSYYEKEAKFWTQKAEKADGAEASRNAPGYSDSLFGF